MKETLDNKQYVVDELMKTNREGMDGLIEYMEDCGFFNAPCSSSFHLNCEFGLVHHTRNVMQLAEKIGVCLLGGEEYNKIKDSVVIASALHDLGKMGQFEKPNYVPNILKSGKTSDAKPYTTNPYLLPVEHEIRSVVIASMFIDLTEEEQFAILYHNGMYGSLKYQLQGKETPLFMIIHFADLWASRVTERKKEEGEKE